MKQVAAKEQGGYVALILVLIISAISLAIALSILLSGTDAQRSLLVSQQSVQARSLATACAEEAMQQMHDNNAFSGTNSLALATGTCSYTVTVGSGNNRSIDASATVSSATRRLKVQLTIQSSSMSVTSWQDST